MKISNFTYVVYGCETWSFILTQIEGFKMGG